MYRFKQVQQAIDKTVAAFGKIDVLINNAGIAWEEDFLDIEEANWRKMLDVNLNGMFLVAQKERLANMVAQNNGGVILNMASTNGIVGEAKYAHYNASKGGVALLTKTMAIELGSKGIRVKTTGPGYIERQCLKRLMMMRKAAEYIRTKIPLGRAGNTGRYRRGIRFSGIRGCSVYYR